MSSKISRRSQRRQSFLQSNERLHQIFNEHSSDENSPVNNKHNKTPSRNRRSARLQSVIERTIIELSSDYESDDNKAKTEHSSTARLRRSTRNKTANKKYTDETFDSPPKSDRKLRNSRRNKKLSTSSSSDVSSKENDNFSDNLVPNETDTPHKTNLFEDVLDIEGKKMYGFNTPKKRGSMALLAKSTSKTPKTPKTPASRLRALKLETPSPSSSRKKTLMMTPDTERRRRIIDEIKTPHHVRNKLKEEISKWVQESTESEFSADGSEYNPNSDDDNEECESDDDDNHKTESEEEHSENDEYSPIKIGKTIKKITHSELKTPSSSITRRNKKLQFNDKNDDYVPECENYFTHHSNHKSSLTSDHTLDRLNNPRLSTDQLFSLLSSMKLSSNHENSIKSLFDEYKSYFTKWLYILNEGYNIILYGLGSKRNLLQAFHKEFLSNQPVIIVNGFFPSLTIKDILDAITNDLLDLNLSTGNNYHKTVNIIENELSFLSDVHLFLIVHNIDGTMLRNSKAQEILCRLSRIPNIHLIASIDHINAPLLWDHTKLSNYNFSWWDVSTMLPYSDETACENSLLIQNSNELALSSLRNVFQSLTTNSKGIFMVIVKYQLKNKGNSNYAGIQFKDLYWSCRESFLVSSDLALRAQLTEFLDHKLIKSKRTNNGSEHLVIPINDDLLQQFMNEQEK